jgi:hypothetical protein
MKKNKLTIKRTKDGKLLPFLNGQKLEGASNIKINYSYIRNFDFPNRTECNEKVEITFEASEVEIIDID